MAPKSAAAGPPTGALPQCEEALSEMIEADRCSTTEAHTYVSVRIYIYIYIYLHVVTIEYVFGNP